MRPLTTTETVAERETEVVKRIQLQREAGFHLHSAMTHLADRRRLKDHYLAVQRAPTNSTRSESRLSRGHWLGIIA